MVCEDCGEESTGRFCSFECKIKYDARKKSEEFFKYLAKQSSDQYNALAVNTICPRYYAPLYKDPEYKQRGDEDFLPMGTLCRKNDYNKLKITGELRWSFDKNKITVYYNSLVNESSVETGTLRLCVYTSPFRGHFDVHSRSLYFENLEKKTREEWRTGLTFLWASAPLAGLKPGQSYGNGEVTVTIPLAVFWKIPKFSKHIHISVVIEEALHCYECAEWKKVTAWTANNPCIKSP